MQYISTLTPSYTVDREQCIFCHVVKNPSTYVSMSVSATTSPADADVSAVTSRIEDLAASIKRKTQRLYKDSDSAKARARMRGKIREEKSRLSSVVEQYNALVPNEEQLTVEAILTDDIVWPWQFTRGGM